MKKLLCFLLFTCGIFYFALAQDSCNLKMSLITCAPGEDLYSTFGHTALRVEDGATGADYIFNYGTFEFSPAFYSQFIRGKLLYSLSVENFRDFISQYQYESRSVQEQILQLTCPEKEKLYSALQINAQEQNRYYRYDFLFDNCTTRAKDIVANNTYNRVVFKNILPKNKPSFRNLIHSYLNAGHEYWSKLGIDILLGAKLDKKVTNEQAMFLPDYLLKGFDSALVNGHSLVTPPQTVLQMPSPLSKGYFFTPAIVFSIVCMLILFLSFSHAPWIRTVLNIFDFLFFFVLGLAGMLLLFMWFATDHTVTANNYNLLWALPTNAIAAFFVHSNKQVIRIYFKLVFGLSILLLAAWFFIPQQMNNALLPLLVLIIYRSWHISKIKLYEGKETHSKWKTTFFPDRW